jgi:Endosomal/lysosomal potassium channel TMEM175/ATP dependent DNA ligase domain
LVRLRSRSCIIDGEAVACDDNGVASFDLFRHHRANDSIFLFAFDLIELNGDDLRHDLLEGRKATLEMILAKAGLGIRFNERMESDGESVSWSHPTIRPERIMAEPKEFISKGRLDALTDGVFAFAMTLLVVKFDLPEDFHPKSAPELISGLLGLGGTFIAYVVTLARAREGRCKRVVGNDTAPTQQQAKNDGQAIEPPSSERCR